MAENFTTLPLKSKLFYLLIFFLSTLPVKSRVETTEMTLKARKLVLLRFFFQN